MRVPSYLARAVSDDGQLGTNPYTLHPKPLQPNPGTFNPEKRPVILGSGSQRRRSAGYNPTLFPCTLHPAPCTLHPEPYTRNPSSLSPEASTLRIGGDHTEAFSDVTLALLAHINPLNPTPEPPPRTFNPENRWGSRRSILRRQDRAFGTHQPPKSYARNPFILTFNPESRWRSHRSILGRQDRAGLTHRRRPPARLRRRKTPNP